MPNEMLVDCGAWIKMEGESKKYVRWPYLSQRTSQGRWGVIMPTESTELPVELDAHRSRETQRPKDAHNCVSGGEGIGGEVE